MSREFPELGSEHEFQDELKVKLVAAAKGLGLQARTCMLHMGRRQGDSTGLSVGRADSRVAQGMLVAAAKSLGLQVTHYLDVTHGMGAGGS